MGKIFLVLGGSVSGKSRFAERLAERTKLPVSYIATGQAFDDETARRIANSRERRPEGWSTIENSVLEQAPLQEIPERSVLVVDSLSGHIGALVQERTEDVVGTYVRSGVVGLDRWLGPTRRLIEFARRVPQLTLVVSEEVGLSVVPSSQMARAYRELVGLANQLVAQAADQTWLVVAGKGLQLE